MKKIILMSRISGGVPSPDLYDSGGAITMPASPIILGTSGINSPSGTLYWEYDTNLLTGSNFMNMGISKDGGSFININFGSGVEATKTQRRVAFGTNLSSLNYNHDKTSLVKMAVVWRGTTQGLWINGSEVLTQTGLDAIPADTFTQLEFDSPSGTASNEYLGNMHQVSLWSTELSTEQLAELTT